MGHVTTGRTTLLLTAVVGILTAVFVLDLLTPLGVAVWILYPVVVLLSFGLSHQWHTYITAAACTLLTLFAVLLFPPNGHFEIALVNRLLAILVFWITAALGRSVRRAAEVKDLRHIAQRLREQATLLDQVPDAVLIRDPSDCIQFWNRSSEKLYGWTAGEALGRNVNELLFRNPAEVLTKVEKALLEAGEWRGELRQVTRDGREITVESRWVLLRDDQGQPRAKLVVNTDVTDRKTLEAQLLRAQRLESIGTLAGGIAHDFNNLLNPILMSAKLLQMNRPQDDREHLLNVLRASAERGAAMVKGLLAFAGQTDRQLEILDPAASVHEIKTILDHTLPQNIQIQVETAEGLWPVRADATQIAQVLMNLCVNARDAMPDGGTLYMSAENRFADQAYTRRHAGARPGPYVLLGVADTGTGIPPHQIDSIFDPFFTTKEQGKGTGLGLSTTLGIVKSHGGFINVYTEWGKGTRFVVHLPALTGLEAESAASRSSDARAGNGELILVVDDEPYIRDTTQAVLEAHDYRVLTAQNGSEAIAVYQERGAEIRVVLLDMVMPVLDGRATMEALRRLDPQIRIVATSGLRVSNRRGQATAARENVFLQKPYSDEQVLAAISRALRTA